MRMGVTDWRTCYTVTLCGSLRTPSDRAVARRKSGENKLPFSKINPDLVRSLIRQGKTWTQVVRILRSKDNG